MSTDGPRLRPLWPHEPALTAWLAIGLAAPAAIVVLRSPPVTRLRVIGVGFLVASIAAASYAIATVRCGPRRDEIGVAR